VLEEVCQSFNKRDIRMMIGIDVGAGNLKNKENDVYVWE
jgi:hypothetical protein